MTETARADQPSLKRHMSAPPEGDRYHRLANATNILADDDNIKAAEAPYNSPGVRAFSAGLIEKRLLDGLSEADADTVAIFSLLDFTAGLQKMAWRLSDILNIEPTLNWDYDDEIAVARRLTRILYLFLGSIQGVEDEAEAL